MVLECPGSLLYIYIYFHLGPGGFHLPFTKALMLVDPMDNCGQAGLPVDFSVDGPLPQGEGLGSSPAWAEWPRSKWKAILMTGPQIIPNQ